MPPPHSVSAARTARPRWRRTAAASALACEAGDRERHAGLGAQAGVGRRAGSPACPPGAPRTGRAPTRLANEPLAAGSGASGTGSPADGCAARHGERAVERRLGVRPGCAARRGEAPGPAQPHAHAHSLALERVELVQRAVAGGERLVAGGHEAGISVVRARGGRVDQVAQEIPHARGEATPAAGRARRVRRPRASRPGDSRRACRTRSRRAPRASGRAGPAWARRRRSARGRPRSRSRGDPCS